MSRMVLIARLLAAEYAERGEKMPMRFYFTLDDIGADVVVTVELPKVVERSWIQVLAV
jgi:hypothetical protein